jgi:hypothetical protein
MKASLQFDLREDQHTFDCMMSAINMHSLLLELKEYLRALEKYHDLTDDQYQMLGDLRAWLQNEISDNGLSHLL